MDKLAQLKAANINNTTSNTTVDDIEDVLSSITSEGVSESQDESTGAFKWPHEAILLLVEEYRKRADDFCSGKVSQKKTWQAVSNRLLEQGYCVTGPQCLSKFSGLK